MKQILFCFVVLAGLLVRVGAASPLRAPELYREPFRPQFHFTPAKNWMNDPNGMVYFEGEFHLFYQYNPFGDKWGHMSWGHAVTRDLVRWEHLPVALPEERGAMIFSGSAVVDWKNTSGFGQKGNPPLIAVYTGHYTNKQNQQIAYSNDRGRTWTKYSGNPVLDIGERDFRDPKVFWHEPSRRWIMAVAWPLERKIRFYASTNLKQWSHLSDFGPAGSTIGIWECPDLFPLPLREAENEEGWVLIVNVGSGAPAGGSGTQYFPGKFDGLKFTLDRSFPKGQPEFVPEGNLVVDFDGPDYRGWKAAGDAFGSAPARGKVGDQQSVDGFRGTGLVNSFHGGDKSQGTLTSPEFEITDDYLSFMIGGGNHPGRTCFNLVVSGGVARTATADNSEQLSWKSWDIRELRGKRARLEVVDKESGGWGHISIDHIVLGDSPTRPGAQAALWADLGPDFYAGVSWNDIPKRDGRRLWIGWMSNWQYANDVPTSPWRSAMSLPRELSLRQTPNGPRLMQEPARELRSLRDDRHRFKNATPPEVNEWLRRKRIAGAPWEIEAEIEPKGSGVTFGFEFFRGTNQAVVVKCDTQRKVLSLDRTRSGNVNFHPAFSGVYEAPLPAGTIWLRLFVDSSSVEVFAKDGESVLTALVLPNPSGENAIQFWSTSPTLAIRELNVWKLSPSVPILPAGRNK